MRAADVMTRDVATVSPDTPLTAIAELLLSKRISGVPVVQPDGRLCGMVSEADVMWRAAGDQERHRSWWANVLSGRSLKASDFIKTHGTRAEDIMSRDVLTVREDTDIEDIIDLFERRRIKRLPVVRDDRLVGVVSRSDLLKILAGSRPEPAGQADDTALRDRLQELLAKQNWTDRGRVNVVVENGVARFSGLVESEIERRALHVAALSITGIHTVEDALTVAHLPAGGL